MFNKRNVHRTFKNKTKEYEVWMEKMTVQIQGHALLTLQYAKIATIRMEGASGESRNVFEYKYLKIQIVIDTISYSGIFS